MPWNRTDAVNERLRFVSAYLDGLFTMTELCARFGVTRQTGYTLIERYHADGLEGLKERSRAPKHCPHRMSEEHASLLLDFKRSHLNWGPRKIRSCLMERYPDLVLPAASTIGELFVHHGLVKHRRARRKVTHPGSRPLEAETPNQVWTADFKGQFKTGDGLYCYPLTVADAYSRYLLACAARYSVKQAEAQPIFEDLFRTYGLPEAIRTDNGAPFASPAFCGLSKLSVWWIKLGIRHDRIEPRRPEQNGAHERMHRTLKAEATRPPGANLSAQQLQLDRFRAEYNEERPHEGIQMRRPATLYGASPRQMPAKPPAPSYPGHFELRRVSNAGTFRFKKKQLFLSDTLLQELIGMEETDDGIWSVYFYDLLLCRIDERTMKLSEGR